MNKKTKRLGLNKETVRQLDLTEMQDARGAGYLAYTYYDTCRCALLGGGDQYLSGGDGNLCYNTLNFNTVGIYYP